MISCAGAVTAAAVTTERARNTVLGHLLTLMVPHAVKAVLTERGHSLFTHECRHRYGLILPTETNITLEPRDLLNPATLLPEILQLEQGSCHDCLETLELKPIVLTNVKEQPLDNSDLVLLCDGSSYYEKG